MTDKLSLPTLVSLSGQYLFRAESWLHQLLFIPVIYLLMLAAQHVKAEGSNSLFFITIIPIFALSSLAFINAFLEYSLDTLVAAAKSGSRPVTVNLGHFKFWHGHLQGKRRFIVFFLALASIFQILQWLLPEGLLAPIFLLLLLLFTPAVIILLCLSENIFHAINPAAMARTIALLGWRYLPLAIIAAGLYLLAAALWQSDLTLISVIVAVWLWLFNCRLMGHLVKDQATEFGLIDREAKDRQDRSEEIWRDLRFRLYQLCRADKIEQAAIYLEEQIAEHQLDDNDIRAYLFEDGDGRLAFIHTQHSIDRLIAQRQPQKAWTLMQKMQQLNQNFHLSGERQLFKLIKQACCTEEQWQYAVRLLLNLEVHYPDTQDNILALNLAKKICSQHLFDDKLTEEIKRHISHIRAQG